MQEMWPYECWYVVLGWISSDKTSRFRHDLPDVCMPTFAKSHKHMHSHTHTGGGGVSTRWV